MWSKEAEEDGEEWEGEQDGILIASAMLIQHSGDLVPQTQILSFLLSLPSPEATCRCLQIELGEAVTSKWPF